MARAFDARATRRGDARKGREDEREMVLYEAMILVSAKAPRTACADILRRLGANVMERGGVVTDVTSYGARTLAYEFRRPGETHFEVRVMRGEGEGARWTREGEGRGAGADARRGFGARKRGNGRVCVRWKGGGEGGLGTRVCVVCARD